MYSTTGCTEHMPVSALRQESRIECLKHTAKQFGLFDPDPLYEMAQSNQGNEQTESPILDEAQLRHRQNRRMGSRPLARMCSQLYALPSSYTEEDALTRFHIRSETLILRSNGTYDPESHFFKPRSIGWIE
jgi:hypothetical protein